MGLLFRRPFKCIFPPTNHHTHNSIIYVQLLHQPRLVYCSIVWQYSLAYSCDLLLLYNLSRLPLIALFEGHEVHLVRTDSCNDSILNKYIGWYQYNADNHGLLSLQSKLGYQIVLSFFINNVNIVPTEKSIKCRKLDCSSDLGTEGVVAILLVDINLPIARKSPRSCEMNYRRGFV